MCPRRRLARAEWLSASLEHQFGSTASIHAQWHPRGQPALSHTSEWLPNGMRGVLCAVSLCAPDGSSVRCSDATFHPNRLRRSHLHDFCVPMFGLRGAGQKGARGPAQLAKGELLNGRGKARGTDSKSTNAGQAPEPSRMRDDALTKSLRICHSFS